VSSCAVTIITIGALELLLSLCVALACVLPVSLHSLSRDAGAVRAGVRSLCPAGVFGDAALQTTDRCSGPCRAGYYCGAGSTVANTSECGSVLVFCPEGSGAPTPVPDGEYGVGNSSSTAFASVACPAGYYCSGGMKTVCPAGTFGCSIRLRLSTCSGGCSAGHYCPAASTSNTAVQCGSSAVYCPPSSPTPRLVDAGFYSTGGASSRTMSSQSACPEGSYCVAGEKVRHLRGLC
jgi:hypothetical protein